MAPLFVLLLLLPLAEAELDAELEAETSLLVMLVPDEVAFDGTVALLESVKSAHYSRQAHQDAKSQQMHKCANLVESTIATVEGNLESDISTVVEACHVAFREVDAEVG